VGDFRLLGPVEVWNGAERVDVGHPRQRTVLAALLADAGRSVPVATLIDRVWGQAPPRSARQSLHAHLTRVRQVVQRAGVPGALVLTSDSYRLEVDPATVDVHRLADLTGRSQRPEHTAEQRVALLRQGMALWRGEPLAGLGGEWVAQTRQLWRRRYADTTVAWARAELAVANPGEVIRVLGDLAAQFPLHESLAAVLMRALVAAGRPAEALAHYAAVRRYLIEELGTEPGADLQDVHRSVLRGEAPGGVRSGPAQLPADIAGFAGRTTHLALLDALHDRESARAVVVSGMAGVGKTALAVHWAHTVAPRFPDGQLYVNLRGFDQEETVLAPADAVRGFLDALGVPADQLPPGRDAQLGRYRTLLADRRVLVVLDNARDAEQVRPLLPAAPGSLALVTSRHQLTGLLATADAQALPLDILSDDEARELLIRRLGPDRVDAEPAAAEEIIAACGGLPLALAITAARARQSRFPLAALAAELAEEGHRLDALDTGDVAGRVRSVFSWSYDALSAPAQRVFRLFSLHPGPSAATAAVASLTGLPLVDTRRLLGELTRASLLTEQLPGRYVSHDLLRSYAAGLTADGDPAADRDAAVRRLLDHYLHTAYAADRLLDPARHAIELPLALPAADARPEQLADRQAATAWLATEHPVLLATVTYTAETGHDAYTWQLTWSLSTYLDRLGDWAGRAAAWQTALRAAERLGDRTAQARAHTSIARTHTLRGSYADSIASLQQALDLYTAIGHQIGQAHTHRNFAHLWGHQGRYDAAVDHARQALALYRGAADERGQADALNQVGWYHAMLGEYDEALGYCRKSLALHERLGNRAGQAHVWDSLGYAHHHLGRQDEAIECYGHALRLAGDLGDRYNQTQALTHLGDAQLAAGRVPRAERAWTEALAILTGLGHPDAEAVRRKLAALPSAG
jgi:DNA-binding SARP family transcriptional activator/tetratricopeptide (TPR) repeat protein